jgi:hypothetical protein
LEYNFLSSEPERQKPIPQAAFEQSKEDKVWEPVMWRTRRLCRSTAQWVQPTHTRLLVFWNCWVEVNCLTKSACSKYHGQRTDWEEKRQSSDKHVSPSNHKWACLLPNTRSALAPLPSSSLIIGNPRLYQRQILDFFIQSWQILVSS